MQPACPAVVVFSDIDGTLVHYPKIQDRFGTWEAAAAEGGGAPGASCAWVAAHDGSRHELLRLPPASTGAVAVTSSATLAKAAALRAAGARLVLITGARLGVLLPRLPFLPPADAYVAENGGRIFYPAPASAVAELAGASGSSGSCVAPASFDVPMELGWQEDVEWRASMDAAAGPLSEAAAGVPPERRSGALWDAYRSLSGAGFKCDARGYTSNFRVRLQPPAADAARAAAPPAKTADDLAAALRTLPPCLSYSFNMRTADVYPAASGKAAAGGRLLARLGGAWAAAAMLCDDDNDLPLAARCARAFVPGLAGAAASMRAEIARAAAAAAGTEGGSSRFVVSRLGGTLGSEEMLDHVHAWVEDQQTRRQQHAAAAAALPAASAHARLAGELNGAAAAPAQPLGRADSALVKVTA